MIASDPITDFPVAAYNHGNAAASAGTVYGGGLHNISTGITGANDTGITQTLHTIEHGISA